MCAGLLGSIYSTRKKAAGVTFPFVNAMTNVWSYNLGRKAAGSNNKNNFKNYIYMEKKNR